MKKRRGVGLRGFRCLAALLGCLALVATTTPIKIVSANVFQNLGPSLAASMSQGTTVAVPCVISSPTISSEDTSTTTNNENKTCDGVVILTRTPKKHAYETKTSFSSSSAHSRKSKVGDLMVHSLDDHNNNEMISSFTEPVLPKRWNVLGESNVVCMTGFSPEVHLLTRLLQEIVESERRILESSYAKGSSSGSGSISWSPPPVKLMKQLATYYQSSTLSPASRPFGVQTLLVGRSSDRSRCWQVWTLDPAGSLRSGRLGAIGKEAPAVLEKLLRAYDEDQDNDGFAASGGGGTTTAASPRVALTTMLRASIESMRGTTFSMAAADKDNHDDDSDTYEAILLYWQEDCMRIGKVSTDDMRDCLSTVRR